MADFLKLTQEDAVEQIVDTIQRSRSGEAPFALVLGSGFSQGLVPTVRELIEGSLPLWVHSFTNDIDFNPLLTAQDQKQVIAGEFWKKFADKNRSRGLTLPLDSDTLLPKDYSAAYRDAFDPKYCGAVGDPAESRRFQRAMMRLDQPRLNAAHFLLASLLGAQPGKSRKSELFKTRSALCRLILTTNFDPFLQIALQAVNRLYVISDTPELGVTDEILDDEIDAIHLVYMHGSVHRRGQATTDQAIQELKRKNAQILGPVLKRHGVIVLGYSGWDDAIVEALAASRDFDHRLYWCGREADPLQPGAFGPRVAGIIQKPTATYVQITGAGQFMGRLFSQLVNGMPRLLGNPIGQIREMLEAIDLAELEVIVLPVQEVESSITSSEATDVIFKEKQSAIERLRAAEDLFLGTTTGEQPVFSRDFASARLAGALGNHGESVQLMTALRKSSSLTVTQKAEVLVERGVGLYFLGQLNEAIADWTQVIDNVDGVPVEQVAKALLNRGVALGKKGDSDQAIADYSHLIDHLPSAPVEQVAKALLNRGVALGKKGDSDQAIADYSRIIDLLPSAPVEQVATALVNRGWKEYERGRYAAFLSDTELALGFGPDVVASFNLGLAVLALGRDADSLYAYRHTGNQSPESIDKFGLPDLINAKTSWLSEERAQPVVTLLQSLRQ